MFVFGGGWMEFVGWIVGFGIGTGFGTDIIELLFIVGIVAKWSLSRENIEVSLGVFHVEQDVIWVGRHTSLDYLTTITSCDYLWVLYNPVHTSIVVVHIILVVKDQSQFRKEGSIPCNSINRYEMVIQLKAGTKRSSHQHTKYYPAHVFAFHVDQ